jgi:hypothetical protein
MSDIAWISGTNESIMTTGAIGELRKASSLGSSGIRP